jgi:WD40 repeat protein
VDIETETPTLLLQGHRAGRVNGLATHPSRRLFVTGGDDHTVRVWDMDARKQASSCSRQQQTGSSRQAAAGELLQPAA